MKKEIVYQVDVKGNPFEPNSFKTLPEATKYARDKYINRKKGDGPINIVKVQTTKITLISFNDGSTDK